MLDYVTQNVNLADIAQITGYPDSSHFSDSIRLVFGLSPKNVFAGSRALNLHGLPQRLPPAPAPRSEAQRRSSHFAQDAGAAGH